MKNSLRLSLILLALSFVSFVAPAVQAASIVPADPFSKAAAELMSLDQALTAEKAGSQDVVAVQAPLAKLAAPAVNSWPQCIDTGVLCSSDFSCRHHVCPDCTCHGASHTCVMCSQYPTAFVIDDKALWACR